LEAGEALVFRAKRIHTFGMRVDLDIAFCDADGIVLEVYRALGPRKLTPRIKRTRVVIEMRAGSMSCICVDDLLTIRDL
jgi:uncharacterized membrane protein (UPF0127 family)